MSEIAEIRKLFQDLIAPDLKALSADLRNGAELATARHNEQRAQIDASESRIRAMMDKANHDAEMNKVLVGQNIAEVQQSVISLSASVDHRFDQVQQSFSSLSASVDHRFDQVQQSFSSLSASVDHRFDQVQQSFGSLSVSVDRRFAETQGSIDKLSASVDRLISTMEIEKRLARIEATHPSSQVA